MIVQPELPDHPDYILLKAAVGDYAMEALIRLWGHCQSNNRGEVWQGKGVAYVEAVARWTGQRGELFRALVEFGWVDEFEGGVKMHNWNAQNRKLLSARSNGGGGGRPRKGLNDNDGKPNDNPSETQEKPNAISVSVGFPPTKTGGSTEVSEKPNHNPTVTHGKPNGNPSVTHPSNPSHPSISSLHSEALRLIGVLNELTGSRFNLPLMELDQVAARLQETGGDGAGVEQMLRRQVALWRDDPRARQWLKPGTLFGTNFHDYYGQRSVRVTNGEERPRRGAAVADRTELLETLAATRVALEENPADAGLRQRVRELEMQTS